MKGKRNGRGMDSKLVWYKITYRNKKNKGKMDVEKMWEEGEKKDKWKNDKNNHINRKMNQASKKKKEE